MDSIILFKIHETKRNYAEIDPANPILILNLWQNNTYALNCNYVEEFRQNTEVPKQHFFHRVCFSSFHVGCSAYQKIKSKNVAKL